jgi:protein-S-isoprenylcysteine O-methyltransferase Ste14
VRAIARVEAALARALTSRAGSIASNVLLGGYVVYRGWTTLGDWSLLGIGNTCLWFFLAALVFTRSPPTVVDASLVAIVAVLVSNWRYVVYDLLGGRALKAWAVVLFGIMAVWFAVARVCLGRSYAMLPARRSVCRRGPYALIRHPIYAGMILAEPVLAFHATHPAQVAVCVLGAAATVVRIVREEKVLEGAPGYADYRAKVRWRVLPGAW